MNTITDIDTTAVPADTIPVLNTVEDLTNLVHDLALKQLVIDTAAAAQKAKVEAAKKAFDEATAPITAALAGGLAAIEKFAAANRTTLFPSKGKKQLKTFKVLGHELKYRAATCIDAPEDIITRLNRRLQDLEIELRSIHPENYDAVEAEIDLIKSLLRQPPIEFNKDAAAAALANEATALQLAPLHITQTTTETFSLNFKFTPAA